MPLGGATAFSEPDPVSALEHALCLQALAGTPDMRETLGEPHSS